MKSVNCTIMLLLGQNLYYFNRLFVPVSILLNLKHKVLNNKTKNLFMSIRSVFQGIKSHLKLFFFLLYLINIGHTLSGLISSDFIKFALWLRAPSLIHEYRYYCFYDYSHQDPSKWFPSPWSTQWIIISTFEPTHTSHVSETSLGTWCYSVYFFLWLSFFFPQLNSKLLEVFGLIFIWN